MCLRRCVRHEQLLPDLARWTAVRDRYHEPLAPVGSVNGAGSRGDRGWDGLLCDCSIRRRVTLGDRASPSATTCTAATGRPARCPSRESHSRPSRGLERSTRQVEGRRSTRGSTPWLRPPIRRVASSPVHLRHTNVHEHDIGASPWRRVQPRRRRSPPRRPPRRSTRAQQCHEAAPNERLIVGDRDADHAVAPYGKDAGDPEAAAGSWAGVERPAVHGDAVRGCP